MELIFLVSVLTAVLIRRHLPLYRRWDILSVGLGGVTGAFALAGAIDASVSVGDTILVALSAGLFPFTLINLMAAMAWFSFKFVERRATRVAAAQPKAEGIDALLAMRDSVRYSYVRYFGPYERRL